jgi:hypothetical protein
MTNRAPQYSIPPEVLEALELGMPKCPVCDGQNVRASHPIGIQDTLLAMARYIPYRCRVCQHRFYQKLAKGAKKPNPWIDKTEG